MSRSTLDYLKHILDEFEFLATKTAGLSQEEFLQDAILQRAFARSLEIVGEAVKNLSDDFRQRNEHIDWKSMAGMRDRLTHQYFAVDYEIVWDTVINKVPKLRAQIEQIVRIETRSS